MSEREEAKVLANKVLDRPWADPDDDLATLARQFLQGEERIERFKAALTDLEMAVSDLMREEDFEVSETLSTALDIARDALGFSLQNASESKP